MCPVLFVEVYEPSKLAIFNKALDSYHGKSN